MNSPLPPRNTTPGTSSLPARRARFLLTSTPRGARRARHLTVRWLDSWGWPPDTAASRDAAVVVELATNAVLHGQRPHWYFGLWLAVHGDATLLVEVTDGRPDRCFLGPQWTAVPPPDAESGRGLLLVDTLTTCRGARRDDGVTKTVWCELDLPGT